jgi:DNA-binding MarR family transcriptional regulator
MSASDAQTTEVLVAIRRIVRMLRLADREAESAHGLSAAQLFVLHSLGAAPANSLAELAERTLTDQSSVSTVVARLVERGLVARRAAKDDRRRSELRVTPAGTRVIAASPRLPQTLIIEAVRAMPPAHRVELIRSLGRLSAAIGADHIAPRMLFEDEKRTRNKRA